MISTGPGLAENFTLSLATTEVISLDFFSLSTKMFQLENFATWGLPLRPGEILRFSSPLFSFLRPPFLGQGFLPKPLFEFYQSAI